MKGQPYSSQSEDDDEYTAVPVIPVDYVEHTSENPFCSDPFCPCHEDEEAIAQVNQAYQDGLLTSEEATDFVNGKTL